VWASLPGGCCDYVAGIWRARRRFARPEVETDREPFPVRSRCVRDLRVHGSGGPAPSRWAWRRRSAIRAWESFVADGGVRVHRGLLGGVAGLYPEDPAKASAPRIGHLPGIQGGASLDSGRPGLSPGSKEWSRWSRWAVAAASPRVATPSLLRMLDTCTLAVFAEMNSSVAISLLLAPGGDEPAALRTSRAVRPSRFRSRRAPGHPPLSPGSPSGILARRASRGDAIAQAAGRQAGCAGFRGAAQLGRGTVAVAGLKHGLGAAQQGRRQRVGASPAASHARARILPGSTKVIWRGRLRYPPPPQSGHGRRSTLSAVKRELVRRAARARSTASLPRLGMQAIANCRRLPEQSPIARQRRRTARADSATGRLSPERQEPGSFPEAPRPPWLFLAVGWRGRWTGHGVVLVPGRVERDECRGHDLDPAEHDEDADVNGDGTCCGSERTPGAIPQMPAG